MATHLYGAIKSRRKGLAIRQNTHPGCGLSVVMMGFRPSFLRFLCVVAVPFAAEPTGAVAVAAVGCLGVPLAGSLDACAPFIFTFYRNPTKGEGESLGCRWRKERKAELCWLLCACQSLAPFGTLGGRRGWARRSDERDQASPVRIMATDIARRLMLEGQSSAASCANGRDVVMSS
jgi:hypothetical protein